MSHPDNFILPDGVQINRLPNGNLHPSDALVDLLVKSRTNYDWPAGTGAAKSQKAIMDLEMRVADLLASLDGANAHAIVRKVSVWSGNNKQKQVEIDSAPTGAQARMAGSIRHILNPTTLKDGLDGLSELPGIGLVIATKVYRFCCPNVGAAVDRHTSYFFNSIKVMDHKGVCRKGTNFKREWANGTHTQSRLATYYPSGYRTNRDEYVDIYLLLLAQIANSLNELGVTYTCAATNSKKPWRPADVEMAAYYWCARSGPR